MKGVQAADLSPGFLFGHPPTLSLGLPTSSKGAGITLTRLLRGGEKRIWGNGTQLWVGTHSVRPKCLVNRAARCKPQRAAWSAKCSIHCQARGGPRSAAHTRAIIHLHGLPPQARPFLVGTPRPHELSLRGQRLAQGAWQPAHLPVPLGVRGSVGR